LVVREPGGRVGKVNGSLAVFAERESGR
jgi:hypothetical protein